MVPKDLTDVFKEAAEIAKSVPDNMQEAAFHRALDALLGRSSGHAQSARKGRRRLSRSAQGGTPISTDTDQEGVSSTDRLNGRKASGRVGPKAALEELVAVGFFKSPKTISEIKSFLESKKGRKYRPTDLSPALVRLLREQTLDREKNAEGQYEYKSH